MNNLVIELIEKFWMENTNAKFSAIVGIHWENWKKNRNYTFWFSEKDDSEYILTETFTLYRKSKNWGTVEMNCTWHMNMEDFKDFADKDGYNVGVCNLKDFKISR